MKGILESKLIQPLRSMLKETLSDVLYIDLFPKSELSDNGSGIHIVAHAIQLIFMQGQTLFLQWDQIMGWEQYALTCAKESPVSDAETYSMSENRFWKPLIGQKLIGADIFGYHEFKYEYTEYPLCPVEGANNLEKTGVNIFKESLIW